MAKTLGGTLKSLGVTKTFLDVTAFIFEGCKKFECRQIGAVADLMLLKGAGLGGHFAL